MDKEQKEKEQEIIKKAIENAEKKKLENMQKFLLFAILVLIPLSIFSAIKIFNWANENKQNKTIVENISEAITVDETVEDVNKYDVDFNKLKQMNSDTVAWFKVNGTNIEYPVVKYTDNSYYMTHNFEKSYNSAGWAFMDYINKLDGQDKNVIIYGHNRRDGSMFSSLKNVFTDDWQNNEDNFIIPFITENEKTEYRVFSIYKIEEEDYYITKDFKSDEDYEKFIKTIKSRSVKDFGVDVTKDDTILTLSTCANDNNHRMVLHAKKIVQQ